MDGRDVEADSPEYLFGLLIDVFAIDQSAFEWFAPQEDVGADIQIVEQVQLLMDENQSEFDGLLNGSNVDRFAVDEDLARAGCLYASQDFHQRAFAGAVFTDDRKDFALSGDEIYVTKCRDARKMASHIVDFEQQDRVGHGRIIVAVHSVLEAQTASAVSNNRLSFAFRQRDEKWRRLLWCAHATIRFRSDPKTHSLGVHGDHEGITYPFRQISRISLTTRGHPAADACRLVG